MHSAALRCQVTWTEDRALLGSTPSAVPGAKTDGGGRMPPRRSPPSGLALCDKPTYPMNQGDRTKIGKMAWRGSHDFGRTMAGSQGHQGGWQWQRALVTRCASIFRG
jgi:hypothetical protein